jgi:signal transduction histidine kinase
VEDVTVKIETQNTLKRALQEMEEASRAKSAFLAAMSHELKTPLNAVLGFAEILNTEMLGPLGNPAYRGYAADIHTSGTRLLGIVNDLLDTARIEGGALTLAKQAVSVSSLIEGGIALGQLRGGARCKVAFEIQPNLPELEVDPQRLMQAIAALVANAIKFTPDEGQITVHGRGTPSGGVRIAVRDTGIGMSQEKIAEAFQPFRQLDNSLARRFEGAGLGLSICKGAGRTPRRVAFHRKRRRRGHGRFHRPATVARKIARAGGHRLTAPLGSLRSPPPPFHGGDDTHCLPRETGEWPRVARPRGTVISIPPQNV